MQLTQAQMEEYRTKGYVLVPGLLSGDEVDVLEDAMRDLSTHDGPEVAREKSGKPHVIYGPHLLDERIGALARHPGLVGPSKELLGKDVFVHQSRVNAKQYLGAIVDWHQDWGTYHRVDGVPRDEGLMISIFMDDIDTCNAPLMCLPGSHVHGLVSEASINRNAEDTDRAAKWRYDISSDTMKRLVDQHGMEPIVGPKGSVLFLQMAVVHGSTVNITPRRRTILYINVCTTDNRGETFQRPEYLAARDFSPLQPLPPDCLTRYRKKAA